MVLPLMGVQLKRLGCFDTLSALHDLDFRDQILDLLDEDLMIYGAWKWVLPN